MKPEDRARLDAAIEHAETIVGSTHNIYEMRWIRGIIDEQDAEIARLKTQSENQARIIDTQRRLAQCGEPKFEAENETLKEQRAEERAKREATVQEYERTCTSIERMRCEEKERADKAGRELDELNAYADARVGELMVEVSGWRQRADKAERELAEERAAHARADAARVNLRDKLDTLTAHSNGVADEVERWCAVAADWKGRAEKAEVRTIAAERELERWRHGSTVEGDFVCPNELRTVDAETRVGELANTLENYRERVAELQAFVDAALPHCYARDCDKLATHSDPHLYGDYACDEHARRPMGRVHYAKYVIALARDLAAKEKESTQ